MTTVLIWILASLASATTALIVGKKYGEPLLVGVYTALMVISQILANKLVMFGSSVVPAAVIVFGTNFLITDALTEFYGKKATHRAIISGLLGSILVVFAIQIAIWWEPAGFWGNQEAFVTTLGFTWRIVLASLTAYLLSQFTDVFVFLKLKKLTNGKHLWLRNSGSTIISQMVDTIVFITFAFIGTIPMEAVIGMIIGQYGVKLIIACIDTPFLYWMRMFFESAPIE